MIIDQLISKTLTMRRNLIATVTIGKIIYFCERYFEIYQIVHTNIFHQIKQTMSFIPTVKTVSAEKKQYQKAEGNSIIRQKHLETNLLEIKPSRFK